MAVIVPAGPPANQLSWNNMSTVGNPVYVVGAVGTATMRPCATYSVPTYHGGRIPAGAEIQDVLNELFSRIVQLEEEISKMKTSIKSEEELRQKYPAMQNAWEAYSTVKALTSGLETSDPYDFRK